MLTPEQARHLIAAVKNNADWGEGGIRFSPWTLDGGTVSTDGKLLVHVASPLGFPPLADKEGRIDFTRRLLAEGYGDAVSVPMARLRAWAGEPARMIPCDGCEKLPGVCWRCKGSGRSECFHCQSTIECEECDGDKKCPDCKGTKTVEDTTERPGMHAGLCVNRTLLAPAVVAIPAGIESVSVSVKTGTHTSPGILRIQGEGWGVFLACTREKGGESLLEGGS